MAYSLTRAQIIDEAINRANQPHLTAEARLWLNLYLEDVYTSQDLHWLKKSTGSAAVSQGMAIPADYRAAASVVIIDSNGNSTQPLNQIHDEQQYQSLKNEMSGTTGTPHSYYVDLLNRTVNFIPAPASNLSWDLSYYHVPALPDHTDGGTDSQTPVWGLPWSMLTDAIYQRALEYADDPRQQAADQKLSMKMAEAKKNNHDRRGGKSQMKMGRSFPKRFQGRRGF